MSVTKMTAAASAGLVWLAGSAGSAGPATAQSVQDFYKGRQLNMIVYSASGSAYDVYSRALVRHFGRQIPGNPTFITQNMMGAGGLRALEYVYNIAPKDGTVLLSIGRGVPFEPMLGKTEFKFDPLRLNWVGSMNQDVSLAISWKTVKIKTFADLTRHELLVPGTGAGADSEIIPIALNNLAGTRFKIIAGYQNTTAAALAMERGELDGIAYWSYSAIITTKPDWIPNKEINLLFHTGAKVHPQMPNVTRIREVVTNPTDKKALEFILAREVMGRPFTLGPDVPADRVRAMRTAFMATMADKEFLAEADKIKLEVEPVSGEVVEKLLRDSAAAPKEVIDRVKAVLERK